MIQRIDVGPRMSEASIHNGVVYLAGQVAAGAATDIGGQTREVLAAIDALLAKAGTDKSACCARRSSWPTWPTFPA